MAREAVVADASVLIALAQIGQLELLPRLFDRVLVPTAVVREVAPSLPTLPRGFERREVRHSDALASSAGLGPGETEVVRLGLEMPGSLLLLDDLHARRVAHSLRLSVIGTAALLVEAKRAGLLESVRPMLDVLIGKGFRLSPRVLDEVLRMAGEV